MQEDVWVLGATGRTGREVARRLHEAGVALVLVGRDGVRLEALAAELDGAPRLIASPVTSALAELAPDPPAVVVNTVGPFTATALQVVSACRPGTHYVDIANELPAVERLLGLDADAVAAGQILVTGAGFGVLATESVLLRLCEGRPAPERVRVDAMASVATEAGVLGSALAGTIVGILSSGGREVKHGQLVESRFAAHPRRLRTPHGEVLRTASGPSGELLAAWRASGADSVVAASTAAPSNALLLLVFPAVSALFRLPGVGHFAVKRMAGLRLRAQERPRQFSWAHAQAEWSQGTVREGWLRAGDGMTFTAAVAVEVTKRLLKGEGRPGAHTPGALFGAGLAESVGGEIILEETREDSSRDEPDHPGVQ